MTKESLIEQLAEIQWRILQLTAKESEQKLGWRGLAVDLGVIVDALMNDRLMY